MHARVAMFEGLDPERADQAMQAGRQQIEEGFDSPSEGLEGAKETMMMFDRQTGKTIGITLFDNEEDLHKGHEALDAMSPPEESGLRRTDVGFYEVAVRKARE